MDKHPIETIMSTTMENIRDMIDVNTVVGDAVTPAEGTVIIPISRVSFGFVAGGGEYGLKTPQPAANDLPFAGGTGAGVTVQPMGFLVVKNDQVRLTPAQYYAPVDRVIEMIPPLLGDVRRWIDKSADAPERP
ncbi:MAG: GerW family sporulation protein [Clostridiales bacterium]|nr:GerW family sporulation protein [Clostridiales bacterium]MDD6872213.1 GerW family sporulation protein [Clostridiales bacterium]MDD7367085.1 GerW family sporulation protein [Clostridiales bacterium]MDY2872046.1 GerW family sporulation protein [Eubacteriales bacterium]